MYNSLLEKVTKVINDTVGANKPDPANDFYSMMFNPEAYYEAKKKEEKRKKIANAVIIGATALAATGELYHIAKRSGLLNKLKRK